MKYSVLTFTNGALPAILAIFNILLAFFENLI
nr:MAG TPA: hypothetical protein [Caudoviricetes sp.]